jgi:phosphatidylglycerol:prolipoprotein diacylglycerol transferase
MISADGDLSTLPLTGIPMAVTPYGLALAAALIACWFLARRHATAFGIDASHVDLLLPLTVLVGATGQRLLAGPGLPWIAVVFCGLAVVFVYSRMARLSLGRMIDMLAMPVVVATALQQVGCYLAGCCWGDVAVLDPWLAVIASTDTGVQLQTLPWTAGDWVAWAETHPPGSFVYEQHVNAGLILPDASRSLPVHPAQLYQAALLLPLIFALRRLGPRAHPPGALALVAMGSYAFLRFGVEFLRADNAIVVANLTMPQLQFAAMFFAALALLALLGRTDARLDRRTIAADAESFTDLRAGG